MQFIQTRQVTNALITTTTLSQHATILGNIKMQVS